MTVSRMTGRIRLRIIVLSAVLACLPVSAGQAAQRILYRIDAAIDYELLTLKGSAEVSVPNEAQENLREAVFFLYANSRGIVDDGRRKHIVVDRARLGAQDLPFSLDGPILRVTLNVPQSRSFVLRIDYHGVVPRSSGNSAGLMGAFGGLLGSMNGNASSGNSDFGLYCYSDGILSLGSFWYPQLAVRKNGRWVDRAPEGLGDVAYSEACDFDVRLAVPADVKVVTSGTSSGTGRYTASNVRDFAVLMSEDYVCKSTAIEASGKSMSVEACATHRNAAQIDRSLEVAGRALQTYSERFGEYPYKSFKVVEGTLSGGAGGMEFSGMTAIAPMLYTDWNAQLRELTGMLGNLGGLDGLLGGLNAGQIAGASRRQTDSTAQGSAGDLAGAIPGQKNALDSLLEMTIVHEAAHQWWAMAVGSDSVREPFVDESLTNYSAILYFEDRYGREAAQKMIDTHLRMPYSMARMLGFPDAPANLPTSAYKNNLQYSAIVYGKGALYYDALRRAVGDEVFFSALRAYYEKYRGHLAGPRSFLELVSAKAPAADAGALYRHWIEETNGDQDISGPGLAGSSGILGEILKLVSPQQPADMKSR